MLWQRMVKRFTSKTEQTIGENDMMIVKIGYVEYAMAPKDAITLAEILQRSDKYEKKYRGATDGTASHYTYHAWAGEDDIEMRLINDDVYRMAKLAGKAE